MGFMIGRVVPVSTYEAVLADLRLSFQNQMADSQNAVELIGLLFARPASAMAREEILCSAPSKTRQLGPCLK